MTEQQHDFKQFESFSDLHRYVKNLSLADLTPGELRGLNRAIKKSSDKPEAKRFALLGNVTLDILADQARPYLFQVGAETQFYSVDINQHYQAVFDENSELHRFNPNLTVLILSLRELNPAFVESFALMDATQREQALEECYKHIEQWLEAALDRLSGDIVIANFPLPAFRALSVADSREVTSQASYYHQLNERIQSLVSRYNRCHLLDLATLVARVGHQQAFDNKMFYLAKIEWSEQFAQTVAAELSRLWVAINGLSKKCLVLDLDNTLWGGVVGEEGPRGVKVGKGDPVGEALYDFQHALKAYKARGILLAICSKNNLSDVEEVFELRPEMPLKLDDFSVVMANWEHKPVNIQAIAEQLNIGVDSLVFIDDNPVEVNMVRDMLPDVVSLLLPALPEACPEFALSLPWFEKTVILDDDKKKAEQYQQNNQREQMKASSGGLEAYLQGLETKVALRLATDQDAARVHQLFTKTNQFNLTTQRYSREEVDQFITGDGCDLHIFSVSDRFGDLGIVGQVLVKHNTDGVADIDSFIMSCRSMGRGVEKAILNAMKRYYFEVKGLSALTARYLPTKKNVPVQSLYEEAGFTVIARTDSACDYKLSADQLSYQDADWIDLQQC